MNFFGLTYLGDNKPWQNNQIKALNVLRFSDEEFAAAFRFIDGDEKGTIEPFEIRALLSRAYGAAPSEAEVAEFLEDYEALPYDQRNLDLTAFLGSIGRMRERAKARQESDVKASSEFKSHLEFMDARHKHARLHHDPQERYINPPTTGMEHGWYTPTDVEQTNRKTVKSCDEVKYAEVAFMNEKLS